MLCEPGIPLHWRIAQYPWKVSQICWYARVLLEPCSQIILSTVMLGVNTAQNTLVRLVKVWTLTEVSADDHIPCCPICVARPSHRHISFCFSSSNMTSNQQLADNFRSFISYSGILYVLAFSLNDSLIDTDGCRCFFATLVVAQRFFVLPTHNVGSSFRRNIPSCSKGLVSGRTNPEANLI